MFGIIVIKECLECLPDFPKQFQEIYEIRDKIQTKDRELYDQLGALYASTMKNVE
jgi:hypothetical protein